MPAELISGDPALAGAKLLCCDVDGVMTDGGLYYNHDGHCMVKFNVLDGIGLKRLSASGVKTCFITMTNSAIISKRAEVLGIDYCFLGVEDKLEKIQAVAAETGIALEETAHIADDINDLSLLEAVGIPVTVPNGVDEVKNVCRFVTRRLGGTGAVRELCDAILAARAQVIAG